ncbi:glycosyl hydrolase [Thiospirochaeta perfilievii]|uniref:Glycosyl hydrolase n=1 Tax=Thiospirochaeta perfilievii TaxID=252967 RepID=A0A5C1QB17_9SPIO|nr:glycoside hydrolase family 3 C-terminal domain-containing protein [Thiospirochaeta perfilievii]QEN03854.1 glycosyl hydrolase [Thiospirochaeta perfilievii]
MSENIRDLLNKLTLEEKASLCSGEDFWHLKGIQRLNIPSIMVTDGPHGLRKQEVKGDHVGLGGSVKATCFPTASATASSWDEELMFNMGVALSKECLAEDVSVLLGPGANIKRSPLCGRNFEYISEDPYLTGKMGASLVRGVQSNGIGTSLKHFALNNQEYRRMAIESVVDDRALREIYLPGFETIIKEAQPWTVMCAYNMYNGEYCSDNKTLLTNILKEEWGHTGLVVTDWGACNNRVAGIKAGLELEMPSSGGVNDKLIVKAVKNGTLSIEEVDRVVLRLLNLIFKANEGKQKDYRYDVDEHNNLAAEIAGESMVLLKNSEEILPLSRDERILVVGEFAKKPRYQGAGSSLINPTKVTTLLDALENLQIKFDYIQGYNIDSDIPNMELISQAVDSAKTYDKVVVIAGLTDDYESEGFDRTHLDMPDSHNKLIESLCEVNENIVVILQNGAPVIMPWIGGVKAVLEGYLGGQASGTAMVNIIFGIVNPSGKIAETFPLKLEDDLASKYFGMGPKTVEYRESIYVGYRYYDKAEKDVLFPFGFGLSYTNFEYSDLKLNNKNISDNDKLLVSLKIKNVGDVYGKEIIQLYVNDDISSVFRPQKELKAFKKIGLNPGEEREVNFELTKRSFAFYDVESKDWIVESGLFNILIGSSSRDIRLEESVTVTSDIRRIIENLEPKAPEYYNLIEYNTISNSSFIELLGRDLPVQKRLKGEDFTITSTVGDVSSTFIGKILYKNISKNFLKPPSGEEEVDPTMKRMMESIIYEMPLRSLVLMSGGKISFKTVNILLQFINSNYLKGFFAIFKPS